MKSLTWLLEQAAECLERKNVNKAEIIEASNYIAVARLHLFTDPPKRAAALLFEEMDQWCQMTGGTVKVARIVELLAEEGLIVGKENGTPTLSGVGNNVPEQA